MGEGSGVGWDYVKFHPDYNKMQSPALCGERDSEGGRRPSERTSTTNHPFSSICIRLIIGDSLMYIYKEESLSVRYAFDPCNR